VKLLIVEDDLPLQQAMARLFREEGYTVHETASGDEGLYLAEHNIYELLVLDVMLPGMSGISLIHHLRSRNMDTPILLLTARDALEDRVKGLDAGADDYVVKPVAFPELLARIRAILRRRGVVGQEGDPSYADLVLRSREQDGYVGSKPLRLTQKEYELLEFLVVNKERILTREQIMDRVWGYDTDNAAGVVDVYVHYVRKKLASFGRDQLIQTVRGVGFMLKGG